MSLSVVKNVNKLRIHILPLSRKLLLTLTYFIRFTHNQFGVDLDIVKHSNKFSDCCISIEHDFQTDISKTMHSIPVIMLLLYSVIVDVFLGT